LTGNAPRVFVTYNYDSTLSAALSERVRSVDAQHVHLFHASGHGSSGSGSDSKDDK
jgi:hypothetical protein